ncbi:MAG TPA: hypothetical protein VGD10_12780 [Allosphingosinicella sp.]|uniref:hypothetical protein n=1 Tax=Allosphingosinicella sp. TaxID=2823234 RepID=UPI002EDB9F41
MKFSYSAVWEETVRMMRSNASLLLGIAGVFFFLPALLVGYFAPQPEGAETMTQMLNDIEAYFTENWVWLLAANIVNMVGAIAIYLLLFDVHGHTVGGAIAGALPILPFYFLLSFLTTALILFAGLWFILPGIYLLGRLVVSGALMVGEGRRSPFAAIGGSWRLTKRKGWAVAGFVVIVAVVGWILTSVVTAVLGSVFILIGGQDGVGGLLVLILASALSALFSLLLVVLFAAIYRRLSAPAASVPGTAH